MMLCWKKDEISLFLCFSLFHFTKTYEQKLFYSTVFYNSLKIPLWFICVYLENYSCTDLNFCLKTVSEFSFFSDVINELHPTFHTIMVQLFKTAIMYYFKVTMNFLQFLSKIILNTNVISTTLWTLFCTFLLGSQQKCVKIVMNFYVLSSYILQLYEFSLVWVRKQQIYFMFNIEKGNYIKFLEWNKEFFFMKH